MPKWKLVYLRTIIVLFIIIIIPFFQNIGGEGWWIAFYFVTADSIIWIYLRILTFWMVEWVLTTLYIQSLIRDVKDQEIEKFDLNK